MGGLCPSGRVVPRGASGEDAAVLPASSASIDKRLALDAEESRRVVKCLLLGTGECGKSTILKQMRILHGGGFHSAEERDAFRHLIVRNALDSIQALCQACLALDIPFDSAEQRADAERVIAFVDDFLHSAASAGPTSLAVRRQSITAAQSRPFVRPQRSPSTSGQRGPAVVPPSSLSSTSPTSSSSTSDSAAPGCVPPSVQSLIAELWASVPVQRALVRGAEFHLLDSASYFLSHSARLFHSQYSPTTADILRSRLPTAGIIETSFRVERLTFQMFDVGGQRGERKKWIHCFDGVTALLFVASLSEYDQVLSEDRTRNRMKESLDLFEGINGLPWFRNIPVILFLNKGTHTQRGIHTQTPRSHRPPAEAAMRS